MPALTTTQEFFDQHNMVQGSLSFVEIQLIDVGTKHRFWKREVAANAADTVLKKGVEYTVVSPGADASSAADWKAIGFKGTDSMGADRKPEKGEKFIADDGDETTALGADIDFNTTDFEQTAKVSYGSNSEALQAIVQGVSSRASIVYIGNADEAGKGAGAGKVRLILENRGYQNEKGAEARFGTSANKDELERNLNLQFGLAKDYAEADRIFVVEEFIY